MLRRFARGQFHYKFIEERRIKNQIEFAGQIVRFGQVLFRQFTQAKLAIEAHKNSRHSPLSSWLDLAIALLLGAVGALLLGSFFKWLLAHEKPLDPADTEMIGVLGRVSCAIRPGGVGEMIFVRDGSRRAVPARSEDWNEIPREEEVVVTRYEKGIAFVRTWAALTQPDAEGSRTENSAKGD